MEYTSLGGTGIRVSRIGLGTWQFSDDWGVTSYDRAKAIVGAALEAGINLFDTALRYGGGLSERFLGRALKELGAREDDIVVVTKIPGEMLSYDDVFKAVDVSLRRLGLTSIPVLLAHWPPLWRHIPTCEYARAFERLVTLGKVEYIGLSDHPIELVEAFRNCLSRIEVDVLQYKLNLAEREAERELLPYAEGLGATFLAWSPLAKGALAKTIPPEKLGELRDYRRVDPLHHPVNYPQLQKLYEEVARIAERRGKTPAQVALNWLLQLSDIVIPIPGATSPEQVRENADATGWRLTWEEWRLLDEASRRVKLTYVTQSE
ncbi:MAG: aldo/keto reductase [Desulfurococcales archaeon]|nr:aldo/keto reductase [Desulfurococcales archaeon]